ncbi:hypothetical protein ABW21_db0202243 [Orbilia brochopaga]|nr:hypothetical protein ABW21_db0202243 [Drechslerella brochopaga]
MFTGYLASHLHLHAPHHMHHHHHHRRISVTMDADPKTRSPKLFIAADSSSFDASELARWEAEGYEVHYLPSPDTHALESLCESLESDERYCIIAFGAAATKALEYAMYPIANLAVLIAYYPTSLPASFPSEQFPRQVRRILLHIPDTQAASLVVPPTPALKTRIYPDAKPGFAEKTSVHYNPTAANLAYSRSLAIIRGTVGPEIDLEEIWSEHLQYEFGEKDASKTMDTMVKEPYVNHVPTLTGGVGQHDLHRFYRDFFIPHNPPSLRLRLLSRTVSADRVVDEMLCSFTHTHEIHWMLPGVKPTDRDVRVALVSIVCIRGRKLYHEHIYWDQASVLKQIGAVDFRGLPVSGAEAADKVADKDAVPSNLKIPGWWKDQDEGAETVEGDDKAGP